MRKCLYLDDQRTPTETLPNAHPWEVVRNYDQFTEWITKNGIPDLISFDHDLADEHITDYVTQVGLQGFQTPKYDTYKEKTGLDCAKWLSNYCEKNLKTLKSVSVHSHNPVGASYIQSYINGFKKYTGQPEDCFLMKYPFKIDNE